MSSRNDGITKYMKIILCIDDIPYTANKSQIILESIIYLVTAVVLIVGLFGLIFDRIYVSAFSLVGLPVIYLFYEISKSVFESKMLDKLAEKINAENEIKQLNH